MNIQNISSCTICSTSCDEHNKCFNPQCIRNLSYKLDLYCTQIEKAKPSIQEIIRVLVPLLKTFEGTIFLTGIGKSAHIMKKCTATWQSLGIKTHSILAQDIFHGDLGILKENDLLIYVSNSGNTQELVNIATYVKEKLNVKQISISNNPSAELSTIVNYSFTLCNFKIKEADTFNFAPSISSVLFMMLFDLLGISISEAKGMTKDEFKLYHPGGDIGKRI
jgi:arabinose-5-phosphate isomerase